MFTECAEINVQPVDIQYDLKNHRAIDFRCWGSDIDRNYNVEPFLFER